jgi:proteasome lid subunit RPN8/RPN11
MVIPRRISEEIVRQAFEALPNEVCGLLATENGKVVRRYAIRNADESPVNYVMDSQEQLQAILHMDDQGWDLGAIYHSHPRTPAFPSATDIDLAYFPEATYLIVSLANRDQPNLRAFHITGKEVREEPIEISD